jgi:integrase/recombinase XerD
LRAKIGWVMLKLLTVKEDIRAFLKHLAGEKDCSENTLAAYRNDLNQLLSFAEVEHTVLLDSIFLRSYLLYIKSKNYSLATTARKIASVKSFFKFMVDSGRMGENPAKNLVSPKVIKQHPKFLSTSEYQRLLAEPVKLDTSEAKRDVVMLEVLYATGLRVSELVSLNIKNIDLEQSCIYLDHSGKRRRISLDDNISQLLKIFVGNDRLDLLYDEREQALFLNRRGGRLTRQGFWQIVKNYTNSAGLAAKVTPHTLRHSFATRKLQSGMDLQAVQKALGHAYISSTRIYTQRSNLLR